MFECGVLSFYLDFKVWISGLNMKTLKRKKKSVPSPPGDPLDRHQDRLYDLK